MGPGLFWRLLAAQRHSNGKHLVIEAAVALADLEVRLRQ